MKNKQLIITALLAGLSFNANAVNNDANVPAQIKNAWASASSSNSNLQTVFNTLKDSRWCFATINYAQSLISTNPSKAALLATDTMSYVMETLGFSQPAQLNGYLTVLAKLVTPNTAQYFNEAKIVSMLGHLLSNASLTADSTASAKINQILQAFLKAKPEFATEIVQAYPASEQQIATSVANVLATLSSDEAGKMLETIGAKNTQLAQSIANAVETSYATTDELKTAMVTATRNTVTGWTIWTQTSEAAPTVNKYQQLVDNILAAKAAGGISNQQAQQAVQQATQQSGGSVVVPSPSIP